MGTGRNTASEKWHGTSVTIDCNETKSLNAEEIAKELLKSGAAHKPTRYEFGGGETYELDQPQEEEEQDNNGGDDEKDENSYVDNQSENNSSNTGYEKNEENYEDNENGGDGGDD